MTVEPVPDCPEVVAGLIERIIERTPDCSPTLRTARRRMAWSRDSLVPMFGMHAESEWNGKPLRFRLRNYRHRDVWIAKRTGELRLLGLKATYADVAHTPAMAKLAAIATAS